MQKTDNYGFNKPESTDFYNVNDFNENMDIIDEKLKLLEENSSDYNTALDEHLAADNPHNITKTDVGLSNVPNVATNNQTPTYTEASSVSELSSGEKLSVAFGKIAKAVSTLISHIANKSNPHGVTAIQVGALAPTDIVDALNSDKDNKPLSAKQGKVLDEKITDLQTVVDGKSTVVFETTEVSVTVSANTVATTALTAPTKDGFTFYPYKCSTSNTAKIVIHSMTNSTMRVLNLDSVERTLTYTVYWIGVSTS